MKAVMISAPNSNSGKTAVSAALLAALRQKGFNVCGLKTGPDQVDRKILENASGRRAGNLDRFLMGKTGMEMSLGAMQSEYAVIEGVMGCFDGIGSTPENSSFETAKTLGIDIILVYTPSGEMFSMIPKLKGFLDFSEKRIKAIILNKIKPSLYKTYKTMIEDNLPLVVLGFFPERSELRIAETGLGLNATDTPKFTEFFQSRQTEPAAQFDFEKFVSFFKSVPTKSLPDFKRTKTKTAIARDACINFYYTENIAVLEAYSETEYFSPLADTHIPDCDFLYFGSGQVKAFAAELSANAAMRASVKRFAEKGGVILAEGESVCYLFETFDLLPMCGIFFGNAESTAKLQNFGYKIVELTQDCVLGKKGECFHAAEYHTSKAPLPESPLFKVTKAASKAIYSDGYRYKNTVACFQNSNFISYVDSFYEVLHNMAQK